MKFPINIITVTAAAMILAAVLAGAALLITAGSVCLFSGNKSLTFHRS